MFTHGQFTQEIKERLKLAKRPAILLSAARKAILTSIQNLPKIQELPENEILQLGSIAFQNPILKAQADSWKTYYWDKILDDRLLRHFHSHRTARLWHKLFCRHFAVSLSAISLLTETQPTHPIIMVLTYDFNLDCLDAKGLHFANFLRYLKRKDGLDIAEIKEESEAIYPLNLKIWNEASSSQTWSQAPATYELNRSVLSEDLKIQLKLLLSSIQTNNIEVPCLSVACSGPFWKEQIEVMAKAYASVLSEKDYGFKALVFSIPDENTRKLFNKVISEDVPGIKTPIAIVKINSVSVAQALSTHYSTSIHYCSDLYGFGHRFNAEEALTTGFLSNHPHWNKCIGEKSHYIALPRDTLNHDSCRSLVDFIRQTASEKFDGYRDNLRLAMGIFPRVTASNF